MSALTRGASYLTLLAIVGCAAPTRSTSSSSSAKLLRADISAANVTTLYEAIQRLRPQWLRSRGQDLAARSREPTVFWDGVPRGGIAFLYEIQAVDVAEASFLSASDAAMRFGTPAGTGGVILVRTR